MSEFLKSQRRESERVLIFSGVFDPVHKGHLSAAEHALEREGRLIVFLPERLPTHKHGRTSFKKRVEMLKLATVDQEKFIVLESPFDRHTIAQTLPWIQAQFPSGQNFGLLFGADVASHFWDWPDVERLADYGIDRLIFANRVTDSVRDLDRFMRPIAGVELKTLKARNDHVSSTLIRRDPKNRASNLPERVLSYIVIRKLYASSDSSAEK
jgi:nicotinate-nucleotide adenylyltransferase